MLAAIAQHLQLTRLVAQTVGPETVHDLIHRLSRRLVLVEEIAGEQDHIHVPLLSSGHDLVEGFPTIIAADRVSLAIANMIVCRNQNANRIAVGCFLSVIVSTKDLRRQLTSGGRHGREDISSTAGGLSRKMRRQRHEANEGEALS